MVSLSKLYPQIPNLFTIKSTASALDRNACDTPKTSHRPPLNRDAM